MGFDFRINEIENTYKLVSFCMYQALKITNHFKDDDCICTNCGAKFTLSKRRK